MKKKIYKLDNIDCANCGMKIEEKVSRLEGVHSCTLNYISLNFTVIYDETILTDETLENTIKKSLFGVKIISKKEKEVTNDDLETKTIENEKDKVKRIVFGRRNKG